MKIIHIVQIVFASISGGALVFAHNAPQYAAQAGLVSAAALGVSTTLGLISDSVLKKS